MDDEAANSLFDEGQLTTGTYKPTKGTTPFCPPLTPSCLGNDPVSNIWPSPAPTLFVSRQLSGFDGKNPNGTCKLYVIDDGLFSTGTFAEGWLLEINTGTDTIDPQIDITTPPQGATYTLGQSVAASYSCADEDSGVATCQGSVPDGANIDTSSTGTKTFNVNATDNAGNTSSVSHTYTVNAQTTSCTRTGTGNAETISGTSGADVLCAGGGNDTVKGLGGNDILKGEAGNDKLLGGVGNDTLDGGTGTDTASYSASLTGVIASLAANTATGEGSDTFLGVENLLGSSKTETLTGSATNKLTGGGGNDTESGGTGNDQVIGSGGTTSSMAGRRRHSQLQGRRERQRHLGRRSWHRHQDNRRNGEVDRRVPVTRREALGLSLGHRLCRAIAQVARREGRSFASWPSSSIR